MPKPSLYVPLREHWKSSNDVLLRELVKNGGELCTAAEAARAQVQLQSSEATTIELRNSRIGDAGAEAFAGLASVTEFVSSPKMTDAALAYLAGMTQMTKLTLWKMCITGDGLKHLAGMTELEQLEVCDCQITDYALSHLPTLPVLSMLNLSSSTSLTSAGLECLTRLPALLTFWLNGANAVGPGLKFLAGHACLKTVDLAGGAERITTDDDLSYLPELPTVQTLYLNYTHVTDRGLRYLTRLPALKTLNLEQTDVSDSGLRELAALASLKSLNLNQTLVTLRGFTELKAARADLDVSAHNCRGEPAAEVLELIQRPEMRAAAPVADSWRRIEAWFAEHLPEALDTLRPPASPEELDEFERRIGRRLPADFRESYLIHDGQEDDSLEFGVILGIPLPSIAGDDGLLEMAGRIEQEWQDGENFMKDWVWFPAGAMREAWGGPGWIPFYWDCGRNYIGLDLDPGPNGFVGQVIPFGTDDRFRPVLAVSFAHLLEDVADEMESGHVVVGVPGVSHSAYWLKGVPNGYLMNSYREWAEAKLPLVFQRAQ